MSVIVTIQPFWSGRIKLTMVVDAPIISVFGARRACRRVVAYVPTGVAAGGTEGQELYEICRLVLPEVSVRKK